LKKQTEISKTLIDLSGEQDFDFAFFQRLLSFQYLSLWMLSVSDHAEISVDKQNCASSGPSPQLPKNTWEQLSQNLALCCIYLKGNPEFPTDHFAVGDKRRGKLKTVFWFSPFSFSNTLKGYGKLSGQQLRKLVGKETREGKLRKVEVIG